MFQLAVSDFVRKVYKMKRNASDQVPDFEGRSKKSNWIAADLGKSDFLLLLLLFGMKKVNTKCVGLDNKIEPNRLRIIKNRFI